MQARKAVVVGSGAAAEAQPRKPGTAGRQEQNRSGVGGKAKVVVFGAACPRHASFARRRARAEGLRKIEEPQHAVKHGEVVYVCTEGT